MSEQERPMLAVSPRRGIARILPLAVGLGVLALVVWAALTSGERSLQPGDEAPDFDLTLLDGTQISLGELRGQVVVLNFWATWCEPCKREAPALQATWEEYRERGVAFVGIAYQDAPEKVQSFVDQMGLTYPNGVDTRSRISGMYRTTGVPETFVIDRQGRVAWIQIGEVTADALKQQLERIERTP